MPEQLQLFASLDFPGRSVVLVREMAERLGVSEKHLFNEIDARALVVLDLRSAGSSRRTARVPIESYRNYVAKHLTGEPEAVAEFIVNLPRAVRRSLILELPAEERRSLYLELKASLR